MRNLAFVLPLLALPGSVAAQWGIPSIPCTGSFITAPCASINTCAAPALGTISVGYMSLSAAPLLGTTVQVQSTNYRTVLEGGNGCADIGSVIAFHIYGLTQTPTLVPAVSTGLLPIWMIPTPTVQLFCSVGPTGNWQTPLVIPSDPAYSGTMIHVQSATTFLESGVARTFASPASTLTVL